MFAIFEDPREPSLYADDLTYDQATEILDNLYDECRHEEGYFFMVGENEDI